MAPIDYRKYRDLRDALRYVNFVSRVAEWNRRAALRVGRQVLPKTVKPTAR